MKALTSIGSVLLVGAALVFGALLFGPAALGMERYVIETGSMTGSIDAGSVVFNKAVKPEDLRVADVITFNPPPGSGLPGIVTHRIHALGRDARGRIEIETKGDANKSPDPVKFAATRPEYSRVVFHVPHLGSVIDAITGKQGRMLLFVLPGLLIASFAFKDVFRDTRKPVATTVGGTA